MTAIVLDLRPDTRVGFSAEIRPDAAADNQSRAASTRRNRLICGWHQTTEGRLVCAWRQVMSDELSALDLGDAT
jgi:hypothetical protein